jgi:hypothetical protein
LVWLITFGSALLLLPLKWKFSWNEGPEKCALRLYHADSFENESPEIDINELERVHHDLVSNTSNNKYMLCDGSDIRFEAVTQNHHEAELHR